MNVMVESFTLHFTSGSFRQQLFSDYLRHFTTDDLLTFFLIQLGLLFCKIAVCNIKIFLFPLISAWGCDIILFDILGPLSDIFI